ncbi:MAG: hypothetical protein JXJ20_03330 [Anaerolineae bacterium]|nr:hypothetical protein [Anaerolineae bacterium]
MSDYDPGDQYEDRRANRRSRRRRQRSDEFDDAWAAANENDIPDDNVEIEDLASGYVLDETGQIDRNQDLYDDDEDSTTDTSSLGPLPPSARRLSKRKPVPYHERVRQRYDRSEAYAHSPSYQKSKRNVVERLLSPLDSSPHYTVPQKPKRDPNFTPGPLGSTPYWAILILVTLGFVAFAVLVLALVSILLLLT